MPIGALVQLGRGCHYIISIEVAQDESDCLLYHVTTVQSISSSCSWRTMHSMQATADRRGRPTCLKLRCYLYNQACHVIFTSSPDHSQPR